MMGEPLLRKLMSWTLKLCKRIRIFSNHLWLVQAASRQLRRLTTLIPLWWVPTRKRILRQH